MVAALLLVGACGSSDDVETLTPTATSAPRPTATVPLAAGDPKTSVETAVSACRVKDGSLLSRLVVDGASESEIDALFSKGSDVQLRSFTFPTDAGDTATVTVGLRVQRETGAEDVERTWELERTEAGWLFTSLPDCY